MGTRCGGALLAMLSIMCTIPEWSADRTEARSLAEPRMQATCGGESIMTIDADGLLRLFSIVDGSGIGDISLYPEQAVRCALDSRVGLVLTRSGKLLAYPYTRGKGMGVVQEVVRLKNASAVTDLLVAGERVVVGLEDGSFLVFSERSGAYRSRGFDHKDHTATRVTAVAISPNGRQFIAAHMDDKIVKRYSDATEGSDTVTVLAGTETKLTDVSALWIDDQGNWAAADVSGIHGFPISGEGVFIPLAWSPGTIDRLSGSWESKRFMVREVGILASRGEAHQVAQVDFATRSVLRIPQESGARAVLLLTPGPDSYLRVDDAGGVQLNLRKPETNQWEASWNVQTLANPAAAIAVSSDGQTVAAAFTDVAGKSVSSLGLWSGKSGAARARVAAIDCPIDDGENLTLAVANQGNRLILTNGATWYQWRLARGTEWTQETIESERVPPDRIPLEFRLSMLLGEIPDSVAGNLEKLYLGLSAQDSVLVTKNQALALASIATGVVITDLQRGVELRVPGAGRPQSLAVDAAGAIFAAASRTDLSLFNTGTGTFLGMTAFDEPIRLLAVAKEGEQVLLKTEATVLCYDLQTYSPLWTLISLDFPGFHPLDGVFTPDGRRSILRCSDANYAIVTNRRKVKLLFLPAQDLKLLGAGTEAVMLTAGGKASVLSIANGKKLYELLPGELSPTQQRDRRFR